MSVYSDEDVDGAAVGATTETIHRVTDNATSEDAMAITDGACVGTKDGGGAEPEPRPEPPIETKDKTTK